MCGRELLRFGVLAGAYGNWCLTRGIIDFGILIWPTLAV